MLQGTVYSFKVTARNEIGQSSFSQPITVRAAQVAAQPLPPLVTLLETAARIDWVAPDDGGAAISGYKVMFAQSD